MSKRMNPDDAIKSSKRIKTDPVADANTASEIEFQQRYLVGFPRTFKAAAGTSYAIEHTHVKSIRRNDLNACFDLIKTTSQDDYAASAQGWRPGHKRREMNEDLMHYLLVRRTADADEAQADNEVVGFLSFMLTYDSIPCVPVSYVYEIHLEESARRAGLGTRLLATCEEIAGKVGIDRIMLTCFVSNLKAYQFYQRLGFEKDETSPEDRKTRSNIVKADIIILGKPISNESRR